MALSSGKCRVGKTGSSLVLLDCQIMQLGKVGSFLRRNHGNSALLLMSFVPFRI